LTDEENKEDVVFPFIEGERVDLVAQSSKWINLHSKWNNDPQVRHYARNIMPHTFEDIKKWFEPSSERGVREEIFFTIYHKKDKCPIGTIAFVRINWIDRNALVFGIIGEKEYWGKGIIVEAAKLLIHYGFTELNLHKINARVFDPNKRSLRAAQKIGFKRVGIMKEQVYVDGKYIDEHLFSIFKKDWMEENSNTSL